MLRLVAIVYWLALITWFAALVAGGATAMASFGTLSRIVPELGITLPPFSEAEGAEAGRFVAGFVAERVFDALATLEWVLIPVLLATVVIQWLTRWPERGFANSLRMALILAASATTMFHLVVLSPRMDSALADYRGAVRSGDLAAAASHKQLFDRDHRISDPILRINGGLLLVAIVVSAAILTPRSVPHRSGSGGGPVFR
jgi:Kef-type K+ transport system membrane component KefB